METKAFFDPNTYTLTFVAYDPESKDAVVIDPVLDFNPLTWRTSQESAQQVQDFVREKSLKVHWVLDTHAHADHLTGMEVLKEAFGAPTAIGDKITMVQKTFAQAYNFNHVKTDGSQWNELLADGQKIQAGTLEIETLHTPGHTPACASYKIGDSVFTGDALFLPDFGTGRCDFPAGSAEDLYESVTSKLYTLPDSTKIFVGHDYQPGGREIQWESTIGASKESNIQLRASTSKEQFIKFRTERDATLQPPNLILESLQVNIDAGRLPEPEGNGVRYFKMPINFLGR